MGVVRAGGASRGRAAAADDDEGWPGLRVWLLSWWITATRYHWFSEARRRETRAYAALVARRNARPPVTIARPGG